jgi:hypothetical protein
MSGKAGGFQSDRPMWLLTHDLEIITVATYPHPQMCCYTGTQLSRAQPLDMSATVPALYVQSEITFALRARITPDHTCHRIQLSVVKGDDDHTYIRCSEAAVSVVDITIRAWPPRLSLRSVPWDQGSIRPGRYPGLPQSLNASPVTWDVVPGLAQPLRGVVATAA